MGTCGMNGHHNGKRGLLYKSREKRKLSMKWLIFCSTLLRSMAGLSETGTATLATTLDLKFTKSAEVHRKLLDKLPRRSFRRSMFAMTGATAIIPTTLTTGLTPI